MDVKYQSGGKCEAGLGNCLPSPGPWHHIYVLQPDAGENHIAGASFKSQTHRCVVHSHISEIPPAVDEHFAVQVRQVARSLGLIREYRDLDEDPLPWDSHFHPPMHFVKEILSSVKMFLFAFTLDRIQSFLIITLYWSKGLICLPAPLYQTIIVFSAQFSWPCFIYWPLHKISL